MNRHDSRRSINPRLTSGTRNRSDMSEASAIPATGGRLSKGIATATAIATSLLLLALAVSAPPAEAAAPGWRVLAATSPTNFEPHVNDRQTIAVVGATRGGGEGINAFRLTFGGSTTPPIDAPAAAATVETALNALPSISAGGGSVSVTGGTSNGSGIGGVSSQITYFVEFDGGPLAGSSVGSITDATAYSGEGPLANGVKAVVVQPTLSGTLMVYPTNVGGASSSGPVTLTVGPLPAGVTTNSSAVGTQGGSGWSCGPAGAGQMLVTCTRSLAVPSLTTTTTSAAPTVEVPLIIDETAAASSTVPVTIEGGGAAHGDTYHAKITVSDEKAEAGIQAFWAGAFDVDGEPFTQAGGHPNVAGTMFLTNTNLTTNGFVKPAGDPRDIVVDLPPGFVGNPTVTDRCPQAQVGCGDPDMQVGDVRAFVGNWPPGLTTTNGWIYNDEPANGFAGQFTFGFVESRITAVASVRSDSDFGVRVTAPRVIPYYSVYGSLFMLEGNPDAANGKAFLTNPTECTGETLPTSISTSSWQAIDKFSPRFVDESPAVTGCGLVPFDPEMAVEPTSAAPDSASGLDASIDLPQEGLLDPEELATSHLKKTVVELPEGLSVNPSAATGLEGCTDAEIGIGSKAAPSCPEASKLGTVEVTSPLVDQPLSGVLYLGTPKSTDPMSGEMLRLFLVVRNDRYGLLIKLPGSTVADPETGRLTATFDENPRVPFDHLEVELRGGSRGLLATPQDCGPAPTGSTLTPWSGTTAVALTSPFNVAGNCGFGFAPSLAAGMSSSKARGSGTFSFKFLRQDGEQWVHGLTASLPQGLLASVKDVPLCTDGQAAAGACPASSRIGTVDAAAGTGNPFVLEQKGTAYLTEGYKGCAYGLAVKVPVVAGPFDGTSPETDLGDVVVRQKVCVDRSTAEVSAISDPLPTIWHGIPLRVRSVTVNVDRPDFMLNPSDCAQKQVGAEFDSSRGATAGATTPFSVSGCSALPFKPNLKLALTGRKQVTTGKHPGVKATVTQQGVGEAGIEQAVVRLPKSLALDPQNAQALCEFVAGTKPDLENHCPRGSIVGRARAKTPLLRNDLLGNVYFVKNVRRDPKTGNEIRTLPMIVVALRGEIAVNLRGESSTTKSGKLVNTFANVPDAPISQFNLNINGGKNGILAVTRTRKAKINLCAGRHTAESEMDGHNGRRHDTDIRMKTPCTKKQTKAAKRQAKRAAVRAKRS